MTPVSGSISRVAVPPLRLSGGGLPWLRAAAAEMRSDRIPVV
jgi:hypothetical protein